MSLPANYNLLKDYSNGAYVETGIWRGDSIQYALDVGFDRIIAIDNDKECINFCKSRFDLPNSGLPIKLIHGDSALCLFDAIGGLQDRITFFLDSHWQLIEGTPKGDHPFPLFDEIYQIGKHHRKDHSIIIDDLLYMTHPDITGWTLESIQQNILFINPNYRFKYIANPIVNNMLIAWVV